MAECGHYTTISGLMSIVQNEKLWATNIKFLNDEHEFQHALDLIRDILPKSRISATDKNYQVHEDYLLKISQKLEALENVRADTVFTLSFSEETDLLSQWRGYCPSNNGYCIVFDVKRVYDFVVDKFGTNKPHTGRCVYDLEQKERHLRNLLNEHWDEYLKASSGVDRQRVIRELSNDLIVLASYFKHPSFKEEQERRITLIFKPVHSETIRFREGRSSIIPYVEIPAPRETIRKIIIGPTAHKHLARRSLEAFIAQQGIALEDGFVEFSKTPYRPW